VGEVVDEVVDPNAARVSRGEDERSLLAAGRSPKEQRSGLVIWRTPGGSWYREEVAVLPLARDRGPPRRGGSTDHEREPQRGGEKMDAPKTGGDEEMKNEYPETPEEKAYWRLLDESEEVLSESARTVLDTARATAYKAYMVRSYCFQWHIEYDEAMAEMRRAAAELTDRESGLLWKLWRAALASAASIDPDDETPAGHRVYRGDVHHYYRMVSDMVERTLLGKRWEEDRRAAEREPRDFDELPF
jgi:hypothetical protein